MSAAGIVTTNADLILEDATAGAVTLSSLIGGGGIGGTLGATDNIIPRADGVGGATLQASLVAISDTGLMAGVVGTTITAAGANPGGASTTWVSTADASLYLGADRISLRKDFEYFISTGVYDGGVMSINGGDPAKIDISDGSGLVVDTSGAVPVVSRPVWTGLTAITLTYLATASSTFVALDDTGAVVQQTGPFTVSQQRSLFVLGRVAHPNNTTVSDFVVLTTGAYDIDGEAAQFFRIFGAINVSGNAFSWVGAGADLQVSKSAGNTWSYGNNYATSREQRSYSTDAAIAACSWGYLRRDPGAPSGFSIAVPATLADPNNYDDGTGTLASVPSNKWTVQRIYHEASSQTIRIHYGQNTYSNSDDAIAGISTSPFTADPFLDGFTLCTYLIVKVGTTALNSANAIFRSAGKFGTQFSGGGGGGTGGGGIGGSTGATDNAILRADGTGGSTVQSSGASIDDSGNITATNISGTNTGDQTISLTGDVTGSGTGSFAATIANDAVTYAKIQNVSAASKLLGRGDSGSGDTEEITLGTNLSISGTTLNASGGAPSYTIISPASIGANQNNYAPTGWSTSDIVRLTGSGNYDITGLDATATTARKLLWNVDTADTFTLKHESGSSTAANRIVCPYDIDIPIAPDDAVVIHYDATTARWRAVSSERRPPMLLSQARRTSGSLISSVSYLGFDSEVYSTLAEYWTFDSAGTWTCQKAHTALVRATISWQAATSGVGAIVMDIRKNAVTVLQEQRSAAEQATDNYTTQVIEVAHSFVATDTLRLYLTNFGGSPTTVANMMIMSIMHVRG